MEKTLKQKTAQALIWTLIDRFGQQMLAFAVGLVLARFYLSPDDYGLMGMIAIFTALGAILLDSGFSNALVRKKEISQADLSSVFYFNLGAGIVLYILLFFAAPFIADFYHQPRLITITRVAALPFLINPFTLIQWVNLTRDLNFKVITISGFIALFCSAAVGLSLAMNGFGVWALVYQHITFLLVRAVCFWLYTSWHPSWLFDKQCIKELWKFSSNILMINVLHALFYNLYVALVGRFYPLRDVGYYAQADKFSALSAGSLSTALQTATYPILAKIGDDEERFQRAIRKIMRVSAFIVLPALFGLSAAAEPLVQLLLTDKWAAIVPYLQKLAIAWVFIVFMNLHNNMLYVRNKARTALYLECGKKSLILLCALIAIPLNLSIAVTCLLAAHLVGFIVSAIVVAKQANYSILCQLKDIFPYFCIAATMATGVYCLSFCFDNNLMLIAVQLVGGTLFYLGAAYLLGSKVLREVMGVLKIKSIK
ncbi:MAG: lipopolysaccharide biosynthesis protein [Prevotellaceae bacterium]|jgi:O-antigen/teichoic acid export membrane protein|nr:lipopolysaccharide biosynthesis protein [Prevotellaceae bacterium]